MIRKTRERKERKKKDWGMSCVVGKLDSVFYSLLVSLLG